MKDGYFHGRWGSLARKPSGGGGSGLRGGIFQPLRSGAVAFEAEAGRHSVAGAKPGELWWTRVVRRGTCFLSAGPIGGPYFFCPGHQERGAGSLERRRGAIPWEELSGTLGPRFRPAQGSIEALFRGLGAEPQGPRSSKFGLLLLGSRFRPAWGPSRLLGLLCRGGDQRLQLR